MKKSVLLIALVAIGMLSMINRAYAPWSTLRTGYAITSDYHGIDVPLGTPVIVTAGTLDSRVTQITFRWHRPNDTVAREVTLPVFTNGTTGKWNNGTTSLIRYAIDTYAPNDQGDWGVQAFFRDSAGTDKAGLEDVIKIKATSFNVIPEVPFGTIVILVTMLGALGVLAIKKRRMTASGMPT